MEFIQNPLLIDLVVAEILTKYDFELHELKQMRFVHSVWDREIVRIISKSLDYVHEIRSQRNVVVGSKLNTDFEAFLKYVKNNRHEVFLKKLKINDFGSVQEKLNSAFGLRWNFVKDLEIEFQSSDLHLMFTAIHELLTQKCENLKTLRLSNSVQASVAVVPSKRVNFLVPSITTTLKLEELNLILSPEVFATNSANINANLLAFIVNVVAASHKLTRVSFGKDEVLNALQHHYENTQLPAQTTELSLSAQSDAYDLWTPWLCHLVSGRFINLTTLRLESMNMAQEAFFPALQAVAGTLREFSLSAVQNYSAFKNSSHLFITILKTLKDLKSLKWGNNFNRAMGFTYGKFFEGLERSDFVHHKLRHLLLHVDDSLLDTSSAYLFSTNAIHKVVPDLKHLQIMLSRSHISLSTNSKFQPSTTCMRLRLTYTYQLRGLLMFSNLRKVSLTVDYYTFFPDFIRGVSIMCQFIHIYDLYVRNMCKRCYLAPGCHHFSQVNFKSIERFITSSTYSALTLEQFEEFEDLSIRELRGLIQDNNLDVSLITDQYREAEKQRLYDTRHAYDTDEESSSEDETYNDLKCNCKKCKHSSTETSDSSTEESSTDDE